MVGVIIEAHGSSDIILFRTIHLNGIKEPFAIDFQFYIRMFIRLLWAVS